MSQHDYVIANQTFPSFRSDLNDALQAAATISAGATAPTTPYAYQLWFDTSTNTYKARNAANSAWVSLFGNDLSNAGITFGDNDKAIFGAGSDLQIYHDGSNSYIVDNGTGDLVINTNGNAISLNANSGGEYGLRVINNGAVNLYHDNALRIATTASGADVAGGLTTTDFDVIPTGGANYYPQIGGGVDGGADAYLALSGGTSGNGNLAVQARGAYGEIKFYTGGSSGSAATTERLRITSTGKINLSNRDFGFVNQNTTVSLADDASIVINAATAGGGLLAIYETANGANALFRIGYASTELLGSGQGGVFANADTDGKVCVFSSQHTITIKNRLGGTKGFYFNMFMAGNDFAG